MGQHLINNPFSELRSIPLNESELIYIGPRTLTTVKTTQIDGSLFVGITSVGNITGTDIITGSGEFILKEL